MTKKHSTKKALITSLLSLILCFSMLLGTTFAWFTDSVTSANNIIRSGNLDVELYYQAQGQTDWTKVTGTTNVFRPNTLWEPGHTEVVKLKVVNEGSLALKYRLGVNVASEIGSENVKGDPFKLSDFIKFDIVDGAQTYTRDEAIAAVDATATALKTPYNSASTALPAADAANPGQNEKIVTMVVYMPTVVGNEANAKKDAAVPSIHLGINLLATQMIAENDSFGNDYDKGASWLGDSSIDWYVSDPDATEFTIGTADELAGLAAIVNGTATVNATTYAAESAAVTVADSFKGKTVKLSSDIDLNNKAWTPIGNGSHGFSGTFDGQGHTVYNLNVSGKTAIGLFGYALNGGNFKNLTVENATVTAEDYAGAILGRGYTDVVNCHAVNVKVTVTPYLLADKNVYDGGAKAGAIVGQLLEGAGNTLVDCTAKDVEITGYRDLGGLLGMAHNNNAVSGCSAQNVTIRYVSVDGIYDDGVTPNQNAGAIVGRIQSSATVDFTAEENAAFTLILPPWNKVTLEEPELVDGVYQVSKPAELAWLAARTAKVLKVSLTADIDMLGATISSIDLESYHTVNGNGYTISNAVVEGAGLFGSAKADGTIKNITLDHITVNNSTGDYAGIVNGQYSGKYENVTVLNSAVNAPNSEYVGGLAGAAYKNIVNCSVENISVTGTEKVGGLIGFFTLSDVGYSIKLENCSAKNVTVTATNVAKSYAGVFFGRGLATSSAKFIFTNCSAAMKDGQVLIGQDYNKNIDVSAINVTTIQ